MYCTIVVHCLAFPVGYHVGRGFTPLLCQFTGISRPSPLGLDIPMRFSVMPWHRGGGVKPLPTWYPTGKDAYWRGARPLPTSVPLLAPCPASAPDYLL